MPTPTFDLISTTTVSNSTTATVTFDTIPQTYTHLVLICTIKADGVGNNSHGVRVRFNNISTSFYRSYYHLATGATGNTTSASEAVDTRGRIGYGAGTTSRLAYIEAVIPNYRDTTLYKTVNSFWGHGASNNDAQNGYIITANEATTAISRIDITFSDSLQYFGQNSKLSLYGVL